MQRPSLIFSHLLRPHCCSVPHRTAWPNESLKTAPVFPEKEALNLTQIWKETFDWLALGSVWHLVSAAQPKR